MNNGKEIFQWHPAFYAAVQVELEEEKELLTFTNEYQLGTKPREVDVLIIKKEADTPLHKNIGKIFPVAVGIVVGHVESEPFHGVDKIFHAVTFPVGTFLRRDESGAENLRLSAGIAGNHFQI